MDSVLPQAPIKYLGIDPLVFTIHLDYHYVYHLVVKITDIAMYFQAALI